MFDALFSRAEALPEYTEPDYTDGAAEATVNGTEGAWEHALHEAGAALHWELDHVEPRVKELIGTQVFSRTVREAMAGDSSSLHLMTVRRRPWARYYERRGKPVPQKTEGDGAAPTGLEIAAKLFRPASAAGRASLRFVFTVTGVAERAAFGDLYRSHPVEVMQLVQGAAGEDAARQAAQRLEREVRSPLAVEPAAPFSVSLEVKRHASPLDVAQRFAVLAALYDSVYYRLAPHPRLHRVEKYARELG